MVESGQKWSKIVETGQMRKGNYLALPPPTTFFIIRAMFCTILVHLQVAIQE
jgi:hypothetical protein